MRDVEIEKNEPLAYLQSHTGFNIQEFCVYLTEDRRFRTVSARRQQPLVQTWKKE